MTQQCFALALVVIATSASCTAPASTPEALCAEADSHLQACGYDGASDCDPEVAAAVLATDCTNAEKVSLSVAPGRSGDVTPTRAIAHAIVSYSSAASIATSSPECQIRTIARTLRGRTTVVVAVDASVAPARCTIRLSNTGSASTSVNVDVY